MAGGEFRHRAGDDPRLLRPDDLVVLDGGRSLLDDMRDAYENGHRHYEAARARFVAPPEIDKYYFDPDHQYERMQAFVNLAIHPFRSGQIGGMISDVSIIRRSQPAGLPAGADQ